MAARINDRITPMLKTMREELDRLPAEAYEVFRNSTPIRTGQARKNTRRNDNVIIADYEYAQRLDSGSSRQAPKGMVEPTQQYLIKRYREITGTKK